MKNIFLLTLATFLLACNAQQKVYVAQPDEFEIRNLDTMVISAPKDYSEPVTADPELPTYHASPTRTNDLLHTKLELSFNWKQEQVLGKATLNFKPYFYTTSTLILDAKGFEIHDLRLNNASGQALKYNYDGRLIHIELDKAYQKEEEYTIYMDYTATPAHSGGSSAITSDKGLFFINPRGETPNKPQQIWTQGEMEHNSRWFPTIDKPNERCTQEIILTVEDRFVTLSNGLLINSTPNDDGTRTDYWKMDKPHAPYLFMLAIGEFAVVEESWEGKPVTYYVEPAYEKDATAIFSNTKEMLDFFSDILGVKYPWPKYAQVVVRDYVSGAMENTTGSIFGDFVQRHRQELIDDHNENIIAHELFHHWFGDLVTCESWANLTMNEGFANYSEYLWLEHKYGRDEADYHLLEEWSGYLSSAQNDIHPLIYFGYEDQENMFDAHSYNKGGSVLHMLRNYVGDEAFFAGLNKYLTDNAYTAVEAHNLRLAFEAVTGEDLNWFFNQWYFNQGHPQLEINYDYNDSLSQAIVTVTQHQDMEKMPAIFELPVAINIYTEVGKAPIKKRVHVNQRTHTFTFDVESTPQLIQFDADRTLLAQVQDNKTQDQYIFQYYNAPRFLDRYEAIQLLGGNNAPAVKQLFADALNDPFWAIRGGAIMELGDQQDAATLVRLKDIAMSDPHSQVRAAAFDKLMLLKSDIAMQEAKTALKKDSAYVVIGAALQYLNQFDKKAAIQSAKDLENTEAEDLLLAVGELYAESGEANYLAFFENNLSKLDGFSSIYFMDAYQQLAITTGQEASEKTANRLTTIAQDITYSGWQRYGATRAMNQMRKSLTTAESNEGKALADKLLESLKIIKDSESNEQLKSFYEQLLQDVRP